MGCGVFSLLLRGKSGASWSAPLVHPLTQCFEQPLVQTVRGRQSVMEAFGRISSSTCPSPRYSHLEIWTLPSPSYLSVLRCWVLPLEYVVFGTRAFLGSTMDTCPAGGFWRTSHFFHVWCTQTRGIPLHSVEWRSVHS